MDERVERAMLQWPNAPAAIGWLGVSRRGRWLLQGEPIANENLNDFIGRNYSSDSEGRWFFQNGPQRTYATLEYTPWVFHVPDPAKSVLVTQTRIPVQSVDGAWVDEEGSLLLRTEHGIGVVDDRDLDKLLPAFTSDVDVATSLERLMNGDDADLSFKYNEATVKVASIASTDVPTIFGFVPKPK